MTYKALVFDMDGTLLNTLRDLAEAGNKALAAHGFPTHPTEAYRYFVGSGARNLVIRALPDNARNDDTIDTCLSTFKQFYDIHWADNTHLYDGIGELLTRAESKNLMLAILTNKPQAFADVCVQEFLSEWSWTVVQGHVEGVPLKPSRDVSARVTKALGVSPADVLYIGDSDIDMHTAANAGYQSIGAAWGFRTEQELVDAGAEDIAQTPQDLQSWLEKSPI